jgi:hypothetical protein
MVQAIVPVLAKLTMIPSLCAIVKSEEAIVIALHPFAARCRAF